MLQNMILRRFRLPAISQCLSTSFTINKNSRYKFLTVSFSGSQEIRRYATELNRFNDDSKNLGLFTNTGDKSWELYEEADGHKFLLGLDNVTRLRPQTYQPRALKKYTKVGNGLKNLNLETTPHEKSIAFKKFSRKVFIRLPFVYQNAKREKEFAEEISTKWWPKFETVLNQVKINDLGKYVLKPIFQINSATKGTLFKTIGCEPVLKIVDYSLPLIFSPELHPKYFYSLLQIVDAILVEANENQRNELNRKISGEFTKFFARFATGAADVSNHIDANGRLAVLFKISKLNFVKNNDTLSANLIRLYTKVKPQKDYDNSYFLSFYDKNVKPLLKSTDIDYKQFR